MALGGGGASAGDAGRQAVRLIFLCIAPLIAFIIGDRDLFLALTVLGVFAGIVDVFRQRQRCLPFPIFLMFVLAAQLMTFVLLRHSGLQVGGSHPAELAVGRSQEETIPSPLGPTTIKTLSVVVAAHNEHDYMARTLEGIIKETPKEVLHELIVVDDGSTPPLVTVLTDFPTVRVLRHEQRRGLIKSKTEGGNLATGDAIMFLDGHVKPEPKWYEPILRHMNLNYKRVVVPIIPILNKDTWEPQLNTFGVKMMFDWSLAFNWFEDGDDFVPCMSGGLFGITRRWWHESGEYDYGMNTWGAENIEQSIRIWTCGGEIVVARDSKISHVFRTKFPYPVNTSEVYINKVRTVEAWFDDYKQYYYQADPTAWRFVRHMGDLSQRLELKKELKCKPFAWYVDKFREVFKMKHMLPEEQFLIRDTETGLCVAMSSTKDSLEEAQCSNTSEFQRWTWEEETVSRGLRNTKHNMCFDANAAIAEKEGVQAFLYHCYPKSDQQAWTFSNGNLKWEGWCIQGAAAGASLKLQRCGNFLQERGVFEMYDKVWRPR